MAFAMFFSTLLWGMLFAITLAGCVTNGGFDWLSIGRIAGFAVVLAAFALICLLLFVPFENVTDRQQNVGILPTWTNYLVLFGAPLILAGYTGWLINAPLGLRDDTGIRYAALGSLAALALLAAAIHVTEAAGWERKQATESAAQQQAKDAQTQKLRGVLDTLRDSDPLAAWGDFAQSRELRQVEAVFYEVLRRIAARSTLEADLAAALASRDTHQIAVTWWLFQWSPFEPSAALDGPMRASIAGFADQVLGAAVALPSDAERAQYIERNLAPYLGDMFIATKRMAWFAGVDLRDDVKTLQRRIEQASPASQAARSFPDSFAQFSAEIDYYLAKRPKQP
ncbi:MAG: hypothetical protein HY246_11640 [Proteobacteria bacterium]|nr:hypothetical protein [Pseudomonadota bacterium]